MGEQTSTPAGDARTSDAATRPHLQIIVASTRPGRVGIRVADWFVAHAREHGAFDVEVVDLAEVDLPMLDEPHHPRLQKYTHAHTRAWSETIQRGDAYVFVMPEYNYGFNAALKNALDYLFVEWRAKPVSFVSYGGMSGGLRAVQMLKQVVTAQGMFPIQSAVAVPFVTQHVVEDPDGTTRFEPTSGMTSTADALLTELRTLTDTVAPLHAPQ